jgi:phage tail sheath gpL-like
MSVDASAVASVLGIETTFVDLREGQAKFLPQIIAMFAQAQTSVTFSTAPWRATSAQAVGARYGYLSPAYLAARELLPAEGDGIDTIPLWIYPMGDAGSSVAASGDITPSGTATKQATYRAIVAGIKGGEFTLPAGAVDVSNACRKIRESIEAALGMPVKPTNTYGTVTSAPGSGNVGNGTCGTLSVTGTPLPGAWTATCVTAVANGGVFKLQDPNGRIVSSALTMTPGVGTATAFDVGGVAFTLTDGTTNFSAGDSFTITVPATNVVVTAGWKGASGNDIYVEIEASESVGLTFAITQPANGAVNPTVDAALALVGNTWASMALNCLNIEDTTALDAFAVFGEARWGALVHKPLVVFTGNTEAAVENATVISAARKTDRVNAQLVAPGSPNLPFVVAARQLARIAKVANNNPPVDYNAQKATGLVPGSDSVQWNYAVRDQANKAGSSTIEVADGVVRLADIVTFYRPTGEDPPGYADVVDIVKLQNVIYNVALRFAAEEWAAAPLIPDDEPTRNVAARKPKAAKAELEDLIDGLADEAIIVNREKAKKTITAVISTSNPKRLDIGVTVQLSGNTKIKDISLKFGFFFGTAPLAA